MPSKLTFAATNPLHYIYYWHEYPGQGRVVASTNSMFSDTANKLIGDRSVTWLQTDNNVAALIAADNQESSYVSWRPIESKSMIVGPDYQLAQTLEDKARIRDILSSSLFPKFTVYDGATLKTRTYKQVQTEVGGDSLVLQIANSTGGKGTFFVTGQTEYDSIIKRLVTEEPVVASRRIEGVARGLQLYINNGRLFKTKWWHRDLVGLREVCNMDVASASRYCGAILENVPADMQAQIDLLSQQIADGLVAEGYEGVFGADIVVEEGTNCVYLIEVNTRFTAVSHLYASAMRRHGEADFLTHQVKGYSNQLTGEGDTALTEAAKRSLDDMYYYLKVQNNTTHSVTLNSLGELGVYDRQLNFVRFGWGIDSLQSSDEIVLVPEAAKGAVRQPGDRLFSLIGCGEILTNGQVRPEINDLLQLTRNHFTRTA